MWVAVRLEPVLGQLDRKRPDHAPAARGVGKDAHDEGAPLDLLVAGLQQIGRLQALVMLPRRR
jgi:hypothetical protein